MGASSSGSAATVVRGTTMETQVQMAQPGTFQGGLPTAYMYQTVPPNKDEYDATQKLSNRSKTDVCCCWLFLAFWIWMALTTQTALRQGDWQRLYHGYDYQGRLCGVDPGMEGKPLLYWPRPTHMQYPICMAQCPQNVLKEVSCPEETVKRTMDNATGTIFTEIEFRKIMVKTYLTVAVGGRFCLPSPESGLSKKVTEGLVGTQEDTNADVVKDHWQDISNAWFIVAGAVPFAAAVGYMYFHVLRCCARALTWCVLISAVLLMAVIAVFCLLQADSVKGGTWFDSYMKAKGLSEDDNHGSRLLMQTAGWGSLGLALIALFSICYFVRAVKQVVGCIEASCMAMWDIPGLLALPFVEILLKIGFVCGWTACFAFVVTTGRMEADEADFGGVEVESTVKQFRYSYTQKARMALYVWGLVWSMEIISAFFQFVAAYSVSVWYFTPIAADGSKNAISTDGNGVACRAVWYGLWYHMGSLALDGAITFWCRFLRSILSLVAAQSLEPGQTNPVANSLACCGSCCCMCAAQVLMYVNKNAVLSMVLHSEAFCPSAERAARLLAKSGDEVASLNGVTFVFQFIGSAIITISVFLGAHWLAHDFWLFNDPTSPHYVRNSTTVATAAGVAALCVAIAFMFVFDIVSDMMLFCWLTDASDGVSPFAPAPLRELLQGPGGHHPLVPKSHGDGALNLTVTIPGGARPNTQTW